LSELFAQTITIFDADKIALLLSFQRLKSTEKVSSAWSWKHWRDSSSLHVVIPPLRLTLKTRLDNGVSVLQSELCSLLRLRDATEHDEAVWHLSPTFPENEHQQQYQLAAIAFQSQLATQSRMLRRFSALTEAQTQKVPEDNATFDQAIADLRRLSVALAQVEDANRDAKARAMREKARAERARRIAVRSTLINRSTRSRQPTRSSTSSSSTNLSSSSSLSTSLVSEEKAAAMSTDSPAVSESSSYPSSSTAASSSSSSSSASLDDSTSSRKRRLQELSRSSGLSRDQIVPVDATREELQQRLEQRQLILELQEQSQEDDYCCIVLQEELDRLQEEMDELQSVIDLNSDDDLDDFQEFC
jgi:hypothetical protein